MASLAPEDFPQMWQRPSYEVLLAILQSLELSPPVWNHRQRQADILAQQESLATQRKAEVTRYLSSVIKSPLAWIDDYDKQEVLWELASKRMSERCGRTAMGEVTRRWPFEGDGVACEPFELIIKEPALTGDSLGFKTWGSSYVLSRHLPRLAATSLFKLFDETLGQPPPTVLELGSGTGLLGVAAAALWQTHVILSDLPNIVPNLKDNTERNRSLVQARGGSMSVGPLTWGGGEDEIDQDLFGEPFQFKASLSSFTTHVFVCMTAVSNAVCFFLPNSSSSLLIPCTTMITRVFSLRPSARILLSALNPGRWSWCPCGMTPRGGSWRLSSRPCWIWRRRCSARRRVSLPGRMIGARMRRRARSSAGWASFREAVHL
ncbi:hypothetical protein MKX07_002064 [Trichoderma sp. CBMAI-0711]|nr:hypothetical protein MKX07_002064 [Trichoderma sp. CBMAI-0711]